MLRNTNPKLRRIQVIANAFLVCGIVLFMFPHPAGQALKDVQHAVAGLLIGVSIGANLQALRLRSRLRRQDSLGC